MSSRKNKGDGGASAENAAVPGAADARKDEPEIRAQEATERFPVRRRGYAPTDAADFAPEALRGLERAGQDVSYLVDRGYPRDSAIAFVGNRFQLTARQRLLLARAVSGDVARRKRESTRLEPEGLRGQTVAIDGFNAIITLEVALSGSLVVIGQDGCARDLAGLKGTYRIIDKTPRGALDPR